MANAVLQGACLREADMSGAQLDAAELSGADLRKANLRGAGFRDARLDAADLRDARLGGAFLVGTSLRGADLRGAYLRLARLDDADLSDANLDGVEGLTQGQLDRAHCNSGTKLPAGLTGSGRWQTMSMSRCSPAAPQRGTSGGQNTTSAGLISGRSARARFERVRSIAADLRGADLRGTNLSGANLSGAHLDGANFFKAVLDGADLAAALLNGAQFLNCAQLVVTRNWQSAFRDETLGCGASLPDKNPSE